MQRVLVLLVANIIVPTVANRHHTRLHRDPADAPPDIDLTQVPFANLANVFDGWKMPGEGLLAIFSGKSFERSNRAHVSFLESASHVDYSSQYRINLSTDFMKLNGSAVAVGATNGSAIVAADAAKGSAIVAADTVKGKQALPAQSWFALLRLTLSFTLIVKTLCIMSNVVLQASPIPIVQNIVQKQSTGETDSAPLIGIFFSGCQSSFYGFFAYLVTQKSGFLILVYSNVVGVTFGVYYIYTFMRNCDCEKMLRVAFGYIKAASAIWAFEAFVIATLPHFRALFFIGCTSSFCSLISAISLLTTLPEVLRTSSAQTLQLPVLIPAALSYLLWSACGVNLGDHYIYLPNMLGLCACTFAIYLAFIYRVGPNTKSAQSQHRIDGSLASTIGTASLNGARREGTQSDLSESSKSPKRMKATGEDWGGSTGGT